jgi:hypothetical protein
LGRSGRPVREATARARAAELLFGLPPLFVY